jgi:hypothetical protein
MISPTFQTRPFCIAELGAAWSRVDNLFPLLAPGLGRDALDGVMSGVAARSMDDSDALDELYDRIREATGFTSSAATWNQYKTKWLNSSAPADLGSKPLRQRLFNSLLSENGGPNHWGQLFDSFVDAALYTADDSVGREEILRAADLHTPVPTRYLYSSDSGADNWIRLCRDPMYRHHRESVDFWAGGAGTDLANLIGEKLDRDDFDFISLGSGDGQKDADLIKCWLESGADVLYYPYDISLPLVSRAIRRVKQAVPSRARNNLRIKAVLADFNHLTTLGEVFQHRDSPNVVSLLGNSLGNLQQDLQFLRNLRGQMSNEDLLVLEVRLRSDSEELPELATTQALRFDFGALEHYLGLSFDQEKMIVAREEHVSSISNTVTTVVTCTEIESRGVPFDEIKLIYIHEYREQDFLEALEKIGFEIVESRHGEGEERFLVSVVRKAPDSRAASFRKSVAARLGGGSL